MFLAPAPEHEALLAPFADRVGQGVGTLFHLSRTAATRAAAAGLTGEEALQRLRRAQDGPLPDNVERSVRDWFGRIRTVEAARALVLRCAEEETADRVMAAGGTHATRLGPLVVELLQRPGAGTHPQEAGGGRRPRGAPERERGGPQGAVDPVPPGPAPSLVSPRFGPFSRGAGLVDAEAGPSLARAGWSACGSRARAAACDGAGIEEADRDRLAPPSRPTRGRVMDMAVQLCPAGHVLELLAGLCPDEGADPAETGRGREPAYCEACGAYFWVVQGGALTLVRNATLDTHTLNRMAGLLVDRGRGAQARRLLEKSIEVSEQDGDFPGRALGLCQLSRLCALEADGEGARIVLGDALAVAGAIQDESTRADLLHEMAGLLSASGELERALELLLAALDIRERTGDELGSAATLHEIAVVRLSRGQADEAIWLCREALDIRQRLGDDRGRAATLRLMGSVHATRGQIDRSLARYEQSLRAFDAACDLHGRAATLGHMAGLLADIGKISEATKLLREAMSLSKQIGNLCGVAATLHQTACLMAAAGKMKGAQRFLQQGGGALREGRQRAGAVLGALRDGLPAVAPGPERGGADPTSRRRSCSPSRSGTRAGRR